MDKAKYWTQQIKLQRASGLSRSAYSAKHGVSESSFHYWSKRLSKNAAEGGNFVPVNGVATPLEVVIGKVTVRVPSGSDLSELRRVVEALS